MNYRHAYHAGNFADVFKHALLARILVYLLQKPAPLRFIDTHAGIGRYDLAGDAAERTGEWRGGIGRLTDAMLPGVVQPLLAPYLAAIGCRGVDGRPMSYPGSPAIAQGLLRRDDRMLLCELHPGDAETLRANMARDGRVKILGLDGYTGLNAFVPPPERRGLVLIDPSFEQPDEWASMLAALTQAHRKWPTGTYALWYPIKRRGLAAQFANDLGTSGIRRILDLQLTVGAARDDAGPLASCGLAVVNPPYRLKSEAETLLPFLVLALGKPGEGGWSARWVVEE